MRKLLCFCSVALLALTAIATTPKKQTSKRKTTSHATKTTPTVKLDLVGEPIDLGLSVLWSSIEIGAKDSLSMGVEIQWGCLNPIPNASKKNYKYYNSEAYCYTKYFDYGDNENDKDKHAFDATNSLSMLLDVDDDAARKWWGNGWRIPTSAELEELANKCTWTLIEESGKRGYRVTGTNGNSIFVTLTDPLERYYWANGSAPNRDNYDEPNHCAFGLLMNSFNCFIVRLNRVTGNWIRPVKDYPEKIQD
jgi:hypothetical protein